MRNCEFTQTPCIFYANGFGKKHYSEFMWRKKMKPIIVDEYNLKLVYHGNERFRHLLVKYVYSTILVKALRLERDILRP